MRTLFSAALMVLVPILFGTEWAHAEVFKCTASDGKVSYSEKLCATEGTKEARVPIVVGPQGITGGNAAKESGASSARASAPKGTVNANAQAPAPNAQGASAPAKSDQQIIAECEANHGTNCSSEQEIAQRRMDERTLTPEELAAQHSAVAGREERKKREAEAKAKTDANAKPSDGGGQATSPKKGH